jgi:uncharacterized protein
MDVQAANSALQQYFHQTPIPLICAYLYGSFARGESRVDSDMDIAVLLPGTAERGLLGPLSTLRGDLERLLHRPVDLVDLRSAPVDLIHRILRDGVLLVERDPYARVQFEVDARNRYFDVLPHLRLYRRGQAA